MIRRPAVAGTFYPGDRESLQQTLAQCVTSRPEPLVAKALIAPHAGYVYSGAVAGVTYGSVRLPRRFIILCPNHTGLGAPVSIMSRGEWETPLGRVMVDKELAGLICRASGLVQESPQAHRNEHALEVHLPFLQYLLDNDFQFVPITVGTRRWESLEELGDALARAVDELDDSVLMISSSDMNHFESAERTEEKDHKAIEHILRLDDEGLYQTVESENISMCGCGPTVSVLRAAKKLGAEQAELIQYSHSGLINGDLSSVVGYAGLVIY